ASGEKTYAASRTQTQKKLADAKQQLDDARSKIAGIAATKWYVFKRDTNSGYVEYNETADRMDAIAKVFPVFFFLIAALVCLTTMTRMVDEQRTAIGTFKALGYSTRAIARKYLVYAASASIAGGVVGVCAGMVIFPTVIFNAYKILYTLPPIVLDFNVTYAVVSIVLFFLVTTLSAFFACITELRSTPATLMRPKAPKAGRRVFLENIGFIWRHLSFTRKVTVRNLLRYKKRFLMTVCGVAGCTALLLCGFGIKDSISAICDKQFNVIDRYSATAGLKEDLSQKDYDSVTAYASSQGASPLLLSLKSVDLTRGANTQSCSIIVPQSASKLSQFILLRNRQTQKPLSLDDNGVILTEKLATLLGVRVGDTVYIKNGDSGRLPVKVEGIAENYVLHYLYLTPALYRRIYGVSPVYNELYLNLPDTSSKAESTFSSLLLKQPQIASVSLNSEILSNFNKIIGSLNNVVLVLIISAGLLAFIVLYNLTNINIGERIREIATIKVLGFYSREVAAYVYRENAILTVIGMLLGTVLGIFLHRYIMGTVEVDMVMFGRNINTPSYFYSAALTIFFAAAVNFVMYFRLRDVDMVESLKTVE
ncbi:MAG: ABC transporter permease, partial [Clostridia bacterium]|nr:ABC transporter permease [Clostridia bacterium]